MFSWLNKWLQGHSAQTNRAAGRVDSVDTAADISADLVNTPGVQVSVDELISMQRYARKLDLSKRSPALAATAGNHQSRFRGRGMDYQESRVYQAGDDIRSMDWRVTARAGKPHTKLYQEERERPVVLFVDFSPSLFFGSVKALKSVVAARVAALLGWATAKKGDRVGALLINGQHKELPPKMGKRGVLNLIRELVAFSDPQKGLHAPSHPNHFSEELQRLRRIARPGSLIFLISDFYAIEEDNVDEIKRHLLRLSQHNDLVAIQIVDPLEQAAPPAGRYAVTDGEHEGILDTRSRKAQSAYNQYFQQHHQRIRQLMRKSKIPLLTVSTADDVASCLQGYFSSRKKASANGQHKHKEVA